MNKIHF
jgi:hypothetical protein